MAKKSINLSKLIKQYDIKDDVTQTNQYGLGSFLKDNAVPLLKTGVGAALTATGAAAPVGIGLMASGAGEIASNELAENPEQAAAMRQTAGLAGTVGGLGAQGAFNSQMAQGGELTQYNGGGTHEENPRGGIDVGPNAQVEDKETRWEDYIFSDRIKIPGKKYTFAEASKKIANKYKRENDSFEKKAKEKEMKGLMAMHESEKEKMQATQQAEFQKAFGGDINTDNILENEIDINSETALPQDSLNINNNQIGQQNQNSRNITPNSNTPNEYVLTPRQTELTKKYDYLKGYSPTLDETKTKVLDNDIVSKRKSELNTQELAMRKSLATMLGAPMTPEGLPDYNQIPDDVVYDKSKIGEDKLNKYYAVLNEKQAIRDAQGFKRKEYYGPTESEKFGYNVDTPLEELNFGKRFLTGINMPVEQKAYGGKIQAQWGLDLNSFEAINQAQNPDIGALASGASQQGFMRTPNEGEFYNYPNSQPTVDNGVEASNIALEQYSQSPNVNNNSNQEGSKVDWGKIGMFAAQNAGNIYNIGKGLQGAEQVDLGQINPQKYDYSKALKNAEDKYASAANIARESIRKGSTSSGQSLSNMIAANTSLTQGQERATRDIMQQQDNQNTGLANQAEQYNLGLRNQESQMNSQNEAMKDQFLAQGISGIGSNIAQFSRDNRADKMQQGYIENLLKTGKYEIDPATGKVRLIGSNNV